MGNLPKRDKLGDRMKSQYEDRTRYFLPRRTYTLLRVDGRAFHTFTKGLTKPYDKDFMACMDAAGIALCKEVAGAKFAFIQSDEISLLATDFEDISSQAWFDGNLQKWVSVAGSIATAAFNLHLMKLKGSPVEHEIPITKKIPNVVFDARVFTIPDPIEVENYFIWRQQDASRNSVTLLASAYASHKQLHAKNVTQRHEIIHKAGDNWAKHPVRFKHGGIVCRQIDDECPTMFESSAEVQAIVPLHTHWVVDDTTPVFTKDRDYLRKMIPRHWEHDASTDKNRELAYPDYKRDTENEEL